MSRRLHVAIGVDPGASAGVAAVAMRRGERPVLLYVGSVYGSTRARWHERAASAVAEAVAVGARHLKQHDEPSLLVGWVELPPPTVTGGRGGLAGDSRGMRSWHGMGVRSGWLRCLALNHQLDLGEVEVQAWTRIARVAPGKRRGTPPADGWHRVLEAGQLVAGAEAELQRRTAAADGAAALERVVCAAEAILIAAACAIHTWGTDTGALQALRRPAAARGNA